MELTVFWICYSLVRKRPASTEALRSTWGIDVGGAGCFFDMLQRMYNKEYTLYGDESIDKMLSSQMFFVGNANMFLL